MNLIINSSVNSSVKSNRTQWDDIEHTAWVLAKSVVKTIRGDLVDGVKISNYLGVYARQVVGEVEVTVRVDVGVQKAEVTLLRVGFVGGEEVPEDMMFLSEGFSYYDPMDWKGDEATAIMEAVYFSLRQAKFEFHTNILNEVR